MADLRLACTGARAGALLLPPFQLRLGELVCLHLPHPVPDESEGRLVEVLTGRLAAAGVRLFGRVRPAAPASDDRAGLFRLLRPLRATRWLRRQAGISDREAKQVLRRIGLDRDWPLTRLAGNPRTLLGLEAAWAGGAEAIVFSTSGCDPSGAQAVYRSVAARLAACPAVHVSRTLFQGGRPVRDCFPGASCVESTASFAAPFPAESA